LAAHTVPPEFRHRPNEYVELICKEMMPTAWDWYQESQFAPSVPFFFDVFTERNAFDLDQTEKLMGAAREFGFALKAHVDQFTNLGGSRLAIEMKATSVDHLDAITEAEVALLATGESVGVVIPTENFNGGKTEFADARKMIDTGCAIAVATDFNPGSAPCPSQLMAMAIAARYQKLLPAECLSATTVNAAHAIGLGDRIGSLEPGKQADLVVLEITDYRQMVYEFGGSLVHAVFKAGKRVH
jgi:imidazolonepropionase